MTVKPVARPRPEPPPLPPPVPFPTVAVKIAVRDGVFFYGATDGERSWSGVSSAPTREAALLDVLAEVRTAFDESIRFVISVPPISPFWRHVAEIQTTLGCLVERADLHDQPLVDAAVDMLTALMPAPVPTPDRHIPDPAVEEPATLELLTVATDGSVRGNVTGYSWLASSGRYRMRGFATPKGLRKQEAVLLAELRAIEAAVCTLRHPLLILTDSVAAKRLISAWMDGHDARPPGFRDCALEQHPLDAMRAAIRDSRNRLTLRWVKGHSGDPLNEGADALARLASRYVRGDSGLTPEEYAERGKGLAISFAEEFGRRS